MKSLTAFVASLLLALPSLAEAARYAIIVGNNALPVEGSAGLSPLRYADDDAARYFQLF